jgi:hypothetical protein
MAAVNWQHSPFPPFLFVNTVGLCIYWECFIANLQKVVGLNSLRCMVGITHVSLSGSTIKTESPANTWMDVFPIELGVWEEIVNSFLHTACSWHECCFVLWRL